MKIKKEAVLEMDNVLKQILNISSELSKTESVHSFSLLISSLESYFAGDIESVYNMQKKYCPTQPTHYKDLESNVDYRFVVYGITTKIYSSRITSFLSRGFLMLALKGVFLLQVSDYILQNLCEDENMLGEELFNADLESGDVFDNSVTGLRKAYTRAVSLFYDLCQFEEEEYHDNLGDDEDG